MLYIGHFSFDELDSGGDVRHGYFSCVVDADSADNAVDAFRAYLLKLKNEDNVFTDIVKIYLEDVIGFDEIPKEPVVTRLQSSAGEFPRSVSHSLPLVERPGIEAFGWAPQMKEDEVNSEEYPDSIPFIEFE